MTEIFERLVAAGIELVPAPEIVTHFIFTRDGFAALVERTAHGFGGIGAAGLLVEKKGLAPLVRRGTGVCFVAKGFERAARADDVEKLKRFSEDLKRALASGN